MQTYKVKHIDDEHICEWDLPVDEWLEILNNPKCKKYVDDCLALFLNEPDYSSTVMKLANKYGGSWQHYSRMGNGFGNFVAKEKSIEINESDLPYRSPWYYSMKKCRYLGKVLGESSWEMTLHDNLVIALKKYLNKPQFENSKSEMIQKLTNILRLKKNIILQGAPGTGKTYNSAALALSICDEDVDYNDHSSVMKRYEELRKQGRICFTTFHQSMDYEDFVEGIKPKETDGNVTYDVEDGIFKMICDNARKITSDKKTEQIDFSKTRIFKMSLGEKGKDDTEIFSYCLENNVVALGWGEDKDFTRCSTQDDFRALDTTWGAKAMEIFKSWMKIGDIILVSDGTQYVKAIARIKGDYEYVTDAQINLYQFRKVEWLYTGTPIPINKLYDKTLSQQAIYGFYNSKKIGKPDFNSTIKVDEINKIITGNVNSEKSENYVLIIDEINRGNVSKIFGELITLLEADKRADESHPITVKLPYSKTKDFSVPSNLYIIGTMNTTDRSVGNIDYAVRRRFSFATLEANRDVVNGVKNQKLFDAVQKFIKDNKMEVDMDLDDLMVGHSYFMSKDEAELELKWEFDIIPLLQEYYKDGIIRKKVKKVSVDSFLNDANN